MGKSPIYSIQILAADSESDVHLKPDDYHPREKPIPGTRPDEHQQLLNYGLERRADGLIYWDSGSRDHPRNWSTWRKIFDTTMIVLLEFYTTIISTTGASVADIAGPEYGLDRKQALLAFTFMYQLGQSIGGCLVPPASELVGRRLPYLVSAGSFGIFCVLVGLIPSSAGIYLCRFVTGFASAVPSVVIAGSVEDIFNSKRRVWIVVLWNVGTTIGLCFGPIYAAYISKALGWRWVYYSAGIVTSALFLALLWIRESRPSLLLARKIFQLRNQTAIENVSWHNPDSSPDAKTFFKLVAVRPLHILFTEPLVVMIATISAVSWGIIYLFTESLIPIYESLGFDRTQATLPFLAVALGTLFTFFPRLWDMRVVKLRQWKQETIEPEDKIMGFAFAAPALFIGLAWFAWTVPPLIHVHWAVPTIALVFVGFAVNELAYTLSGYLSDSYLLYSASAFSGLAFVRALVSGLMPLIAHEMFTALNANIAGSILAGIAAVFCVVPWIFFRYSKRLRQRSPFARFSLETHRRTQVETD